MWSQMTAPNMITLSVFCNITLTSQIIILKIILETDPDQESGSGSKDDIGHRKRGGNPLVRMMRKMTKKHDPEKKKNVTIEMLQPSRYKPSDLNQMAEDTKFSKSEFNLDKTSCLNNNTCWMT